MKRLAVFMLVTLAGITLLAGSAMAKFINGDLELVGLVDLYKFTNADDTGQLILSNIAAADRVDFIGSTTYETDDNQALVLFKSGEFL